MSNPNDPEVFRGLTWKNFRQFYPKDLAELRNAWNTLLNPDAVRCWYVLLMDVVAQVTAKNSPAFPPRLYALPGEIDPNATWTDEIRRDLVQELFEHLYKRNVDADAATGNQFIYIENSARNIEHARALLMVHVRRVLNTRLRTTEVGRLNDNLWKALNKSPFVTVPANQPFSRSRPITLNGWDQDNNHDEAATIHLAVKEFALMSRNKVQLGVINPDGHERAPNWYNTSELVKAVERIITRVVKGPVTPDYLVRALEIACRDLDLYRESSEYKTQVDDFSAETGPDEEFFADDVRFEGVRILEDFVPVEFNEVVGQVRADIMIELTRRHPTRDVEMLYWKSQGLMIKEIAAKLGVVEKTVNRNLNKLGDALQTFVSVHGEQAVGVALRLVFSSVTFSKENL